MQGCGSGSGFQISLDPGPVSAQILEKKIAERSLKVIYQKKTRERWQNTKKILEENAIFPTLYIPNDTVSSPRFTACSKQPRLLSCLSFIARL